VDDGGKKFRKKLASRSEDGSRWTPRDAVEDIMERIDNGELSTIESILIIYSRPPDEDPESRAVGWNWAGPSKREHLELIEVHKQQFMDYAYRAKESK